MRGSPTFSEGTSLALALSKNVGLHGRGWTLQSPRRPEPWIVAGPNNIQRVRERVAAGGHNVPEAKIRERRERSLQQLPWFLDQADRALIYDNSGANPVQIGRKLATEIIIDPDAPDEIKLAAESLRTAAGPGRRPQ